MVLQEFAREKNIVIENNIPEDLEVFTDGKLMGIVFNNLISNAIKFSDQGGRVIVSAEKKNGKILIFVKDFGAGMSPKQVEHLFTGDQIALKHQNSGTGLGLIVVRDIINKLGGRILVESEPEKGTRFTIELEE
jgi:signal transduction histidine kinase